MGDLGWGPALRTQATEWRRGGAAEAGRGEVGSGEALRNGPAPDGAAGDGTPGGDCATEGPGRDGAQGRERAWWTARRSGGPGWAGSAPRDAGSRPPDAAAEHNKAVPPPPPTAPHPPGTGPVDSPRPAGRLDRGTGRDRAGGAPSGQTSRPRPLTSGSALHPRRHPGPRLRDLARRETGRRWRQWLLTP